MKLRIVESELGFSLQEKVGLKWCWCEYKIEKERILEETNYNRTVWIRFAKEPYWEKKITTAVEWANKWRDFYGKTIIKNTYRV